MAAKHTTLAWLVCKRLPQMWPRIPVSKQVAGSKTTYTLNVSELTDGGAFTWNRKLLMYCARALYFKSRSFNDISRLANQNKGIKSSQDKRGLSTGDEDEDWNEQGEGKRNLKLMDFKELIWPHPLKSLRNLFFSFLIRGYIDENYSPDKFLKGAEQAIACVSDLISEGNFEDLEGLVSHEAIHEIKRNYQKLTVKQRQFVSVNPADIFFRFIYEIGMIFDEATDERFVEITTVFQGIHGFAEAREKDPDTFAQELQHAQDQVYVANYRFIREYTKGKPAGEWTINKLNHFSPKEIVTNANMFRR